MAERLLVLGAGESGIGAAILAQKERFEVVVSDSKQIGRFQKAELSGRGILYEEFEHTKLDTYDLVVKSPGIPDSAEVIKELKKLGKKIISEIEFAGMFNKSKTICITGSNGKTTTTLLTWHILNNAGLKPGLAGNIGKSFARLVAEDPHDIYVLELSSFQLDYMFDFKADIAVLLNITPDHLDRYDYKMENYVRSKFRIIQNQTENDVFIYCSDDEEIGKVLPSLNLKQRLLPFSIKEKEGQAAYLENQEILIPSMENPFNMNLHNLALQGKHNVYNSMAAALGARCFEVRKDVIRDSLADFRNAEHRLEPVLTVHGVEFINDSKATNVNSTWYALESMNKPVVLILGGVDKGNDYTMLRDLVKEKVKAIICLGKDNKRIHDSFEDIVPIIQDAKTAVEAVKLCYYNAKKGDVVLLSPACASFDLFENYEDRGRKFKDAVRSL